MSTKVFYFKRFVRMRRGSFFYSKKSKIVSAASCMVSVPNDHLIAVRGHPAVLGCHFTPYPDLSSLVIVWQRQEDSRVVHSFYYEQNQLGHQSPEYHKRTSLYISELGKGNASLRIDGVGLKDVGWYLCKVSNIKEVGNAKIKLDYGAFYSEPRLSIHANSTTVMVQFETEGFPKPEVIWLDEHGQSLIHHLELHDQTEDGLYLVKSSYEAQKPVVNVTFTLKNHLLNQKLQRPVIFSYGKNPLSLWDTKSKQFTVCSSTTEKPFCSTKKGWVR
ncbi:CD276 antigen-like isoform X2 [Ctenopharyngodon idella]|uniref:CD276 antigen-like isoform X2 n=1 Tax=Ctenopharyngodon idella TaxID=7959 RepID=UPI002230750D|nr:CD276 antigen-like isoform X2 [Ctenopharyngodon idella]